MGQNGIAMTGTAAKGFMPALRSGAATLPLDSVGKLVAVVEGAGAKLPIVRPPSSPPSDVEAKNIENGQATCIGEDAAKDAPQVCTVENPPPIVRGATATSYGELIDVYLKLGKIRLTSLVVFTTFVPYYMCGGPVLSMTFVALMAGTALQGMGANGFNQVIERRVDALMPRTRRRPLVLGVVTVPHALAAVSSAAVVGSIVLYFGTNPLACYLGLASLITYVCLYTPLKVSLKFTSRPSSPDSCMSAL
jgi:hypothetical protein